MKLDAIAPLTHPSPGVAAESGTIAGMLRRGHEVHEAPRAGACGTSSWCVGSGAALG